AQVAEELNSLPAQQTAKASVALVFDYVSAWAWDVQPQGADFDYFRLCFAFYRALRRAGLSVDILSPDVTDLSDYKLILAPGVLNFTDAFKSALTNFKGTALIGPRSNSKTPELDIPVPMPPALNGLDAVITQVESFPPNSDIKLTNGGRFLHWFEHIESTAEVVLATQSGQPALIKSGAIHYLAGWPDDNTLTRLIKDQCDDLGIETLNLPDGLRVRDTASHRFFINYAPETLHFEGRDIASADVVWVKL
ncbi:MAG: beta-galactosidase trimerization domain-containing protein, partial [Pseudoruegeria sp.]